MTDAEILEKVKFSLGFENNDYHDSTLLGYIEDVIFYMIDAGVSEETCRSRAGSGCVCRGVIDSWNYGTGADVKFSTYFYQRLTQLVLKEAKKND